MKTKGINFTVLICVKDALIQVEKCLNSIIKHTSNKFELLIINDNSNVETSSFLNIFCKKHSNIKLTTNVSTLGYTKSLNIGLRKVLTDFVIVVNSDIIVTHNWSAKLLMPLLKYKDIAITSPLSNAALWQSIPDIFDKKGNYKINNLPESMNLDTFSLAIENHFRDQYAEVSIVNGFCMAIRNSLFDKVGYFDEANFPMGYGEETDFCIRSGRLGYKILVKLDTYIYHCKSSSFGHVQRKKLTLEGNHTLDFLYGANNIKRLSILMRNNISLNHVRNQIQTKYYSK